MMTVRISLDRGQDTAKHQPTHDMNVNDVGAPVDLAPTIHEATWGVLIKYMVFIRKKVSQYSTARPHAIRQIEEGGSTSGLSSPSGRAG
jgi:hypothetical protein